jgi:hypothetical protein
VVTGLSSGLTGKTSWSVLAAIPFRSIFGKLV